MALSGMHIVAGYAGTTGTRGNVQPLLAKVMWSQTMANPGSATKTAPPFDGSRGTPVFQFRASADSYAAIGSAPDAVNGDRIIVPAGETVTVYAEPGDKVAWTTA